MSSISLMTWLATGAAVTGQAIGQAAQGFAETLADTIGAGDSSDPSNGNHATPAGSSDRVPSSAADDDQTERWLALRTRLMETAQSVLGSLGVDGGDLTIEIDGVGTTWVSGDPTVAEAAERKLADSKPWQAMVAELQALRRDDPSWERSRTVTLRLEPSAA